MADFINETYDSQDVAVDGNRYVNCTFTTCRLVFGGGDVPVFERCTFSNVQIKLEGEALQTGKYLNGLYRGGLSVPVELVLAGLQRGQMPISPEPIAPPKENTGDNFAQLGRISLLLAVITVVAVIAIFYSYIIFPRSVVASGRPLRTEISFDAMPILPDNLENYYDLFSAEQLDRLDEVNYSIPPDEGFVTIPIDVAMEMFVEQQQGGN